MTKSCFILTLPTKMQADLLSRWDRQWHPFWEEILYLCPLSSISLTVAHWPLLTSTSEDCALQYNWTYWKVPPWPHHTALYVFLTYFHSVQTVTFQGSAGVFSSFSSSNLLIKLSIILLFFLPILLQQCILTETNMSMSPYKESSPCIIQISESKHCSQPIQPRTRSYEAYFDCLDCLACMLDAFQIFKAQGWRPSWICIWWCLGEVGQCFQDPKVSESAHDRDTKDGDINTMNVSKENRGRKKIKIKVISNWH